MALKPSDTVVNDLPSTGNDTLDALVHDLAEIGLAGLEGKNWTGYASAPRIPLRNWQPVARKVMTVETAILIVHLCHLHAAHRVFVVSALDQYRNTVSTIKGWALTTAQNSILKRIVSAVTLKAFHKTLSWVGELVDVADDSEFYRKIQIKIRRQALAGKQDAIESYLRFGQPQHRRITLKVATRKPV
jgi:hypothetical protein